MTMGVYFRFPSDDLYLRVIPTPKNAVFFAWFFHATPYFSTLISVRYGFCLSTKHERTRNVMPPYWSAFRIREMCFLPVSSSFVISSDLLVLHNYQRYRACCERHTAKSDWNGPQIGLVASSSSTVGREIISTLRITSYHNLSFLTTTKTIEKTFLSLGGRVRKVIESQK